LVVISIVAVLIGILLPSLARARNGAKSMLSQAGLRQMMTGYSVYQNDHRGAVLWGFAYDTAYTVNTEVRLASGTTFANQQESARYPFRLGPYVAELWKIMHIHRQQPLVITAGAETDPVASPGFYNLSLAPAYGLNSFYVGGHGGFASATSGFGGFYQGQPNRNRHVVFRIDEVRKASDLITFAESKNMSAVTMSALDGQGGADGKSYEGTFYVRPPGFARVDMGTGMYPAATVYWKAGSRHSAAPMAYGVSAANGMPSGWFGDGVATAFIDGHVKLMTSGELEDMRYWANKAESATDTDFAN
jgi:type II secretory pathway pseudopilin PulG